MKKIFLILAIVFAAMTATAQVKYGVRLGVGRHSTTEAEVYVHDDNGPYCILLETGWMIGPTAGMMATWQGTEESGMDWLGIQAELNYAMRGFTDEIGITSPEKMEKMTVRSSYLELPVLAKVYPVKQLGLNLQAGPQVGLLLGRSVSIDADTDKAMLKGDDHKIDFGLAFGLGYEHQQWTIDLRYYLGMAETYKDMDEYKNRGLSLSVGYYFR